MNKHKKNSTNENNWIFLDMQNLHKGVQEKGWKINWKLFRSYLRTTFSGTRAFAFMGYIKENEWLYDKLKRAGFILEFRPVKQLENGMIDGGNVDADLASFVMDYKNEYSKAIIVADDADYYRTIKSLNTQGKLKLVISSHPIKQTSQLIKHALRQEQLLSIHWMRKFIS